NPAAAIPPSGFSPALHRPLSGLAGNQHEGRDLVAETDGSRAVVLVATIAVASVAKMIVIGRARRIVVDGARVARGLLRAAFRLAFRFHGVHLFFGCILAGAGCRRAAFPPAATRTVAIASPSAAGGLVLLTFGLRRQRVD